MTSNFKFRVKQNGTWREIDRQLAHDFHFETDLRVQWKPIGSERWGPTSDWDFTEGGPRVSSRREITFGEMYSDIDDYDGAFEASFQIIGVWTNRETGYQLIEFRDHSAVIGHSDVYKPLDNVPDDIDHSEEWEEGDGKDPEAMERKRLLETYEKASKRFSVEHRNDKENREAARRFGNMARKRFPEADYSVEELDEISEKGDASSRENDNETYIVGKLALVEHVRRHYKEEFIDVVQSGGVNVVECEYEILESEDVLKSIRDLNGGDLENETDSIEIDYESLGNYKFIFNDVDRPLKGLVWCLVPEAVEVAPVNIWFATLGDEVVPGASRKEAVHGAVDRYLARRKETEIEDLKPVIWYCRDDTNPEVFTAVAGVTARAALDNYIQAKLCEPSAYLKFNDRLGLGLWAYVTDGTENINEKLEPGPVPIAKKKVDLDMIRDDIHTVDRARFFDEDLVVTKRDIVVRGDTVFVKKNNGEFSSNHNLPERCEAYMVRAAKERVGERVR